jgi:predicted permease
VREEHAREIRDLIAADEPTMRAAALDILRASPGAHWDVLRQDLRLAFRQLRRAPAFALIACLTLAAGIGGNVAFFTLVDGVLLRPLPIAGADRVVDITEENVAKGMRTFGISPANFRDVTRDTTLFQAAAAYHTRTATARMGERYEPVSYTAVSGDFFGVFTDPPLLGRTLAPEDDVPGGANVVVSHAFWRGPLGGDPDVLGHEIEVDGKRLRVVGVMPDHFTFPQTTVAFWQPIGLAADEWQSTRGARFLNGVARLRPRVTPAHAAAALDAVSRALQLQHPATNDGWTVLVRDLRASRVDRVRTPLLLVWGAGGLVLLIAVANVSSLFLSRAVARRRELALRAALGARSGRVVRQLVTEGLVLAAAAAAAGVALAHLVLVSVRPLATGAIPRMQEVALGGRSLAYAALLVLLTTALLSALAAWPLRRQHVWTALGAARGGAAPRPRRLQRRIVVAEVAVAVFVLIGGALVIRTLAGLLTQPMGFEPAGTLTFRVEPPWRFPLDGPIHTIIARLEADRRRANEGYAALARGIEALPGVRRVGAVNRLPLTGDWWTTSVSVPERPSSEDERTPVYVRPATPGYLEAMGTRLLRGRWISPGDLQGGERVLVVDAEFARRTWDGADALGREVLLDGPPGSPRPRARVVGVVEAVHMNRLDGELRPTMYMPLSQSLEGFNLNWGMDVVARGASARLEPAIRRIVRDAFPDAAVFGLASMDDVVRASTAQRRFQLTVLAFFGVLALVLATIGVGGALLLAVRERRGELAVRMALGARGDRVWWEVQRDGLAVAGTGALIGLAGAVAGARLFSSVVYGVSVRDPVALVAAPLLMLAAAFLAAAIPATRAVRVSPIAALRE